MLNTLLTNIPELALLLLIYGAWAVALLTIAWVFTSLMGKGE